MKRNYRLCGYKIENSWTTIYLMTSNAFDKNSSSVGYWTIQASTPTDKVSSSFGSSLTPKMINECFDLDIAFNKHHQAYIKL